jgi:hypothetical protein
MPVFRVAMIVSPVVIVTAVVATPFVAPVIVKSAIMSILLATPLIIVTKHMIFVFDISATVAKGIPAMLPFVAVTLHCTA